jgi:hypothetical protein
MPTPELPAYGPPAVSAAEIQKLVIATQVNAAATLTAALIAASSGKYSVNGALDLMRDVQFSLWPLPGNRAYDDWKKKSNLDVVL